MRGDLTLWLLASRFTANVSVPGGAELSNLQDVGPGVRRGILDGFPTFLVDLQQVPFSPDTIPLHMMTRGKQERALVEYLINHAREYRKQLELLGKLHTNTLAEVLAMSNMGVEDLGTALETLIEKAGFEKVLHIFGPEKLLEHLGPEKVMRHVPPERVVQHLGKEAVLRYLVREYGEEELLRLIRGMNRPPETSASPESHTRELPE